MKYVASVFVASLILCFAAPKGLGQEKSRAADAKPAFLGVELENKEGAGVYVSRVVLERAAAAAGMLAEDRILGIADRATDTADDVRAVLQGYSATDPVQLVFRRAKELHVVEVTLGARPPSTSSSGSRARRLAEVLQVLRPQAGQVVADIGCGSGWLAIGVAEVVGETGRVYAVEIDREDFERMRDRGIGNIEVIPSKPDDVTLPEHVLDIAVLHDVASHVKEEERPKFYASVARALKVEGQLVIFGPHGKARAMLDELSTYGFRALDEAELSKLSPDDLDKRLEHGIRFLYRAP